MAGQVALQAAAELHHALVPSDQEFLREGHVVGRENKVDDSIYYLRERERERERRGGGGGRGGGSY